MRVHIVHRCGSVLWLGILLGCTGGAQPAPAEHEAKTTAAWEALLKKDFQEAIKLADLVIDKYGPTAARLQEKAVEAKLEIPVGPVTPNQKEQIHLQGPLNDVAACHYIRGCAAHKLGQADAAKKSFQEAAKLTAARVWDPAGKFFWAVAPAAARCVKDPTAADKASHELITADAWQEFERGNWKEAIRHADTCIHQFQDMALALQEELTRKKESFPEGAVTKAEQDRIFRNGLLNDVCTNCFIKGQAAEKLGDLKTAVAAYTLGAKITHARCWDPRGWFWNPSQSCRNRLSILK